MELVTVVLEKDEAGCIPPTSIQAICDGDAMAERDELRLKVTEEQGEPVAWRYRTYTRGLWYVTARKKAAYVFKDNGEGSEVQPLYTRADPNVRWKAVADEQIKVIAGLRAEISSLRQHKSDYMEAAEETRNALLAQLAEAHALLKTHTDHVAQLCDEMFIQGLGMDKEAETKIYAALAQQQKVLALLSASVEPSAPKCDCDMRTKIVGDGCSICNPSLAAELSE